MADPPDPDKLKGPGGMTMRELHELVKRSAQRDQAQRPPGKLTQPQSRWQRAIRYVWGKSGKR
jgi:hypothetical protein